MRVTLALFGGCMLAGGILLCLKPSLVIRWSERSLAGGVRWFWALVTLGIGGVLIWAAPASRATSFIQVLGGITFLKGIFLLCAPKGWWTRLMTWWKRLPRGVHLVWGLVSMALGIAVLVTR